MRSQYTLPLGDHDFSSEDQVLISKAINQVKDWLLAQKGMLVTPVHYKSPVGRFTTLQDHERYGLLKYRGSAQQDRREVFISKQTHSTFSVLFDVDFGQLTADEKLDPHAFDKRKQEYQTGTREYIKDSDCLMTLVEHLKNYLLNGLIPFDCQRT